MIKLHFKIKPLPKQSARITSRGSYQSDVVKKYEQNLLIEALSQRPRGFVKMAGPIYAKVRYVFERPSSVPESEIYKTSPPDVTDNLNKPLFDALEGNFYYNDSQIAKVVASKVYGKENGIFLTLVKL